MADERVPALVGEPTERLGQQPRLADSGITGEQHHPGVGVVGRAEQVVELGGTTDDALSPAPVHPHIGHHPARRSSRRHQRRFGTVSSKLFSPRLGLIRVTRSCIPWNM